MKELPMSNVQLSTAQMGTFDAEGNYVPRVITEDNLVGTDLTALVENSVLEFEDGDLVTGTVVKIDHDEAVSYTHLTLPTNREV